MDSRIETWQHIHEVQLLISEIVKQLIDRSYEHDKSKLKEPELKGFDEHKVRLQELEYGTTEYVASLEALKATLQHHYANNTHHPDHFENGINDMTLIDIIEMLCDWKAATKRQKEGDIQKSLKINQERFCISDQLLNILQNTVKKMGW